MKKTKGAHQFTVVGYFEDSTQIFNAHVVARNSVAAVTEVAKNLKADLENLVVVSVFKGHISDLNEAEKISFASDW